jgi:Xaa-Pro aminopeptidase
MSLAIDYRARVAKVSKALRDHKQDVLFVTPGADLKYLTGYEALPLERLTALAICATGEALMVVPHLELPAAQASGIAEQDIALYSWQETQNPYELLASETRSRTTHSGLLVGNLMWVEKAYGIAEAFGVQPKLAGKLLSDIRSIKDEVETQALIEAGAAIDAVHSQMAKWLRAGRTEREVGRDIAEAILAAGHARVDFVIVASGPNGASPHHEVSDRVIEAGDPVVVDIGGTMPSGYCSDSTRMYCVGAPTAEYLEHYEVLKQAQVAAVEFARPGVSCESVDSSAREILSGAGLGEFFIHRTGHGIGLETHEEPYIVEGNTTKLVPGHAFSIEPGFYIPGKFGARIEDIVVCTQGGIINTNNTTHDLVIL